jgi:DNA-binding NtrC family response regulator
MISTVDDRQTAHDGRVLPFAPHLVLLLECDRPLAGGMRIALDGLQYLDLGRGDDRALAAKEGSSDAIQLTVPDARMSSRHACLIHRDQWILEDVGSRNGVFVRGAKTHSAVLADGDTIQIGRTFFLFRETLPTPPDGPACVNSEALAEPLGLRTLVPLFSDELERLRRVASSELSMLILGETGTGKEVLAKAIHEISGRSGGLVAVNCGALPESLVESQLFGHVRGSFTGAVRDELGFVRTAEGGTLFLDEIGELPLPAQAKLLRVLQEREVVPVGATRAVAVNFRVVAATHRPLEDLVRDGRFRADLQARLQGYVTRVPPLRERMEDIGLLLSDCLKGDERRRGFRFDAEVFKAFLSYNWPLNVRELDQVMARAEVLAEDGFIRLPHLPEALRGDESGMRQSVAPRAPPESVTGGNASSGMVPLRRTREADGLEVRLSGLLETHRGNVAAVGRELGCAPVQVRRWAKHFGMDLTAFRK